MPRQLFAVLVVLLCCIGCQRDDPRPPQRDPSTSVAIEGAGFAAGRLWMLSNRGQLSSTAIGEDTARIETFSQPASDLCIDTDQPVVITRGTSAGWALSRRTTEGGWNRLISRSDAEDFQALACDRGQILIVTRQTLVVLDDQGKKEIPLKGELKNRFMPPIRIASVYTTPRHLFLGFNGGEWGGGLQRVDRLSGEILDLEWTMEDTDCDLDVEGSCDFDNSILGPVNGLAPSPSKPGCFIVAEGLSHLGSTSNELKEVCDRRIRSVYRKPTSKADALDYEVFGGLAASGDEVLAVGETGLYRLDRNDHLRREPWPRFQRLGPVYVNLDQPDTALIATEIVGRYALNGWLPQPLIIRR